MAFARMSVFVIGAAALLATAAARAQPAAPPMIPQITGTLTYHITGATQSPPGIEVIHIDHGTKFRISAADDTLGYSIALLSAGSPDRGKFDTVWPSRKQFIRIALDKHTAFTLLLPTGAAYHRIGPANRDGRPCTLWRFTESDDDTPPGTACIDANGVVLTMDRTDVIDGPQHYILASRVDAPQPAGLFVIPPDVTLMPSTTIQLSPKP